MGSWRPGLLVLVSSGKVFGPISGYVESDSGNMQFCGAVTAPCGAETEFSDTQFCGAFVAPLGSETDPLASQFCGVTVVPSGPETETNGAQVHGAAASSGAIETDLEIHSSMVQWLRLWVSRLS